MRYLGICENSGRQYEGSMHHAIPVTSGIHLLPISFIGHEINISSKVFGYSYLLFREDSFDPITRIRRGRVYKASDNQPNDWHVQDPLRADLPIKKWGHGQAQVLNVIEYQQDSMNSLENSPYLRPIVQLGEEPFCSFWQIISIETGLNGLPQLILKAKNSLLTIPELIENRIPLQAIHSLKGVLEKVENAANRLGPIDTIDRCRDALSIIFSTLANDPTLDLGKGISHEIKKNKERNPKSDGNNLVTINADIVRRLHARGKPNEQERYNTRQLTDQDAELALRSLWFVLVELGWAHS